MKEWVWGIIALVFVLFIGGPMLNSSHGEANSPSSPSSPSPSNNVDPGLGNLVQDLAKDHMDPSHEKRPGESDRDWCIRQRDDFVVKFPDVPFDCGANGLTYIINGVECIPPVSEDAETCKNAEGV